MAEVAQLKENGAPQLEAAERGDRGTRQGPRRDPEPAEPGGARRADEHGNVERSRFNPCNFAQPKEHFELGEAMRLMDFETAAKFSGSRFVVLKGQLAKLERALGQFMLDLHTSEHGYTEVAPPLLVRDHVMFGTGQLPKMEEDQFQQHPVLEPAALH